MTCEQARARASLPSQRSAQALETRRTSDCQATAVQVVEVPWLCPAPVVQEMLLQQCCTTSDTPPAADAAHHGSSPEQSHRIDMTRWPETHRGTASRQGLTAANLAGEEAQWTPGDGVLLSMQRCRGDGHDALSASRRQTFPRAVVDGFGDNGQRPCTAGGWEREGCNRGTHLR